ncbi:MAG: complex I subunit 1 family protein [Candidatus Omnitrophota bacterium]
MAEMFRYLKDLFCILIFPGFLFLTVISFFAEFIDRKLYARLQNRIGPPWFQPVADFIKLLGKEAIIPRAANQSMFKLMPLVALSATVTTIFYIPLWNMRALYSFDGDVIVVLYLLTIPTLAFFIGGWYSTSLFARIGSVRSLTQLFSYEVPLFIAVLSSALLADSWSLSRIAVFYDTHPWYWLYNVIGFGVAVLALLAKLEKAPFDIPEAETEVVAGIFTEYSGRFFAMLRLTLNIEMVVGAAFLAAVFLPFGYTCGPFLRFGIFMGKIFCIVAILSLSRALFARLRIDQMIIFCWKYMVPLAFVQLLINLFIKGMVLQ